MRFAFFGSPNFAAIILERLIGAGFAPDVVVCNPDRPVGRKQILTAPPTKQLILAGGQRIEVLQPEKLDPSLFAGRATPFDFFIVAAYARIIPSSVFSIPRLGTIGVHPSLLPRHRGATPIQTAILNGDAKTGTTLFLIDEKVDHGAILKQAAIDIERAATYEILEKQLAELSGDLLVKTLPDFLAGKIKPAIQNEADATYTKKFSTQDGFVEEKDLAAAEAGNATIAVAIDRRIRALNPEPGVWIMRDGKRIKLLSAEIRKSKLVLKKIQIEGKMPVELSL